MLIRLILSIGSSLVLLLSPVTTRAQTVSIVTTPAVGITVMGVSGSAGTRADSIQLALRVGNRLASQPVSSADIDALCAAMLRAGATQKSVMSFAVVGTTAAATVAGTLAHPSAGQLQSAIDTLEATVKASPTLTMQSLAMTFTIDDCTPVMARARTAAIARAHTQATEVARDGGVHLGRLLSLMIGSAPSALQPADTSANGCQSTFYYGAGYPPYTRESSMFNMRVYATVTATYAIR